MIDAAERDFLNVAKNWKEICLEELGHHRGELYFTLEAARPKPVTIVGKGMSLAACIMQAEGVIQDDKILNCFTLTLETADGRFKTQLYRSDRDFLWS